MGYIWAIYYLYLLTYLLFPFPVGYPGTRRITRRRITRRVSGYGSPIFHDTQRSYISYKQ